MENEAIDSSPTMKVLKRRKHKEVIFLRVMDAPTDWRYSALLFIGMLDLNSSIRSTNIMRDEAAQHSLFPRKLRL